jgi:hypothetical protein
MIPKQARRKQAHISQKSAPKQVPRLPTRATPVPVKQKTPKAEPLVITPSSKKARVQISQYVGAVVKENRSFNIISRNKHIAVLGPVSSLPSPMSIQKTVTVSEIADGKPTFSSVIHHGPYMVMRHSKEVAVLYSPQPTEHSRVDGLHRRLDEFLQRLDDVEVLKLAFKKLEADQKSEITRLSGVRRKAEAMAKFNIDFLRRMGKADEADKLLAELTAGDKDA